MRAPCLAGLEAVAGQHDAGLDQLFVKLPHLGQFCGGGHHACFGLFGRLDNRHNTHGWFSFECCGEARLPFATDRLFPRSIYTSNKQPLKSTRVLRRPKIVCEVRAKHGAVFVDGRGPIIAHIPPTSRKSPHFQEVPHLQEVVRRAAAPVCRSIKRIRWLVVLWRVTAHVPSSRDANMCAAPILIFLSPRAKRMVKCRLLCRPQVGFYPPSLLPKRPRLPLPMRQVPLSLEPGRCCLPQHPPPTPSDRCCGAATIAPAKSRKSPKSKKSRFRQSCYSIRTRKPPRRQLP